MTGELLGRGLLRALDDASIALQRHVEGHDSAVDAVVALERAVASLTGAGDEVVLTITDDGCFLGTRAMPQSSIEFNGLLATLRDRGVDSITFLRDPSHTDVADLAGFVADGSHRRPSGATVRLNERPHGPPDLEGMPMRGLRRTYAASLETLRAVSRGGGIELDRVAAVVDGFLDGGPGATDDSLLLATVRGHDETTFYHSVNVCLLSLALGRAVGLGGPDLRVLGIGALLHDVGRVILDDPALRTVGSLSDEQWAVVRLHPQEGAEAILEVAGAGQEAAAVAALEHHVRVDGGGYPDLAGRTPHAFSRIVAIADGYDAATSHRPHRPARMPQEALSSILEESGTAYDPDLAAVFARMMGRYPPGSLLRLEGGEVVVVTGAAGGGPSAVVVRDAAGVPVEAGDRVSLDAGRVAGQIASDAGFDPAALVAGSADPPSRRP